jgi:hypothetical protein
MKTPSVGLIALWTGALTSNVEHMKNMAIHQMTEDDLDLFEKYVREAGFSLNAITKYVKQVQDES